MAWNINYCIKHCKTKLKSTISLEAFYHHCANDLYVLFCTDFCEVKELTKLEGEASASNRKGKLIFFYEWEIEADWTGKVAPISL